MEFENIWARYGLKDSPYNVKALSLIGSFDIKEVFCGRDQELLLWVMSEQGKLPLLIILDGC